MKTIDENAFAKHGEDLLDDLKKRIQGLKQPESVTKEIYDLIAESETDLGKPDIPEAFKCYQKAIEKTKILETSLGSDPIARHLLYVEFGYLLVLLLLGYLTFKWPEFVLWNGMITLSLKTVWFGALGGITISIYGIYNHIRLRNFDPQFKLWYYCKPVIGGIFGWFVFLVYYIGFVSAQGMEMDIIKHPEIPFIIAFLAGFSERFTIKMIDKLMAVLTTFSEDKSTTESPEKDLTNKKP